MSRYLYAAITVLWVLVTASWMASGLDWRVPMGASAASLAATIGEFENHILRRELRRKDGAA